jgi:hypothetical protein
VRLLRIALGAALLLAALGTARAWLAPASELRAVRAEMVQGLRWLRAERGSSPRWNVPEAVGEEGVLSSAGWGAAILYHARRPVAASVHAAFSDPSSLAEAAHALLGPDPEALLHYARATQLRYVIVGPTLLDEAKQLEQLADAHSRRPGARADRAEPLGTAGARSLRVGDGGRARPAPLVRLEPALHAGRARAARRRAGRSGALDLRVRAGRRRSASGRAASALTDSRAALGSGGAGFLPCAHAADRTAHAQGLPRLPARGDDPARALIETARAVYRSYGFLPIDTPALEYEEILTGKGGEESDKQLYRFEDHGGRKVALRFDLTVPLARFVAQHSNELGPALQALPHRHGLARREHAARPLPRVHAVRLRHDRRRRRGGPTSSARW